MQSYLTPLEFDRVLTLIALEAKTVPGKQAIARREPLRSIEACELAQLELAEMVRFYLEDGLLPFAGLADVAQLLDAETADLETLWAAVRTIRATQAVREALLRSREMFRHLADRAAEIPDLGELLREVSRYFTRDGALREEASAELRGIRIRIQQKRQSVQKTLFDLMNKHPDSVQESIVTIRGDRYCIPVKTERRSDLPGILHERSGSGASFFIEPIAVVELNNDLADLLIQEREEIARIIRFIAQRLGESDADIRIAAKVTGEIDAIQACAVFARTIDAHRPLFSATGELRLVGARHPLLDERLDSARSTAFGERGSSGSIIPTTLTIDHEASALLISGPNAGGKTVALKTAGLLVAMAMSGLPVPAADGTVIPVVDHIHVLVGDDQNVLEHLSTFSGYLVRLNRILREATSKSLVLLDELGSGTDPEEGAALAAAVVEHLLLRGSLLVVTTHLSSLKTLAVKDARVVNASMEFDPSTGRPTFTMVRGIPGRSRAIEVAEMIGLPSEVIAAARTRLGDEHGRVDELLGELQKMMAEVTADRQEAASLRLSLELELEKSRLRVEALEAERRRLADVYRDEVEKLKDDVGKNLRAELKKLRETDRLDREKLRDRDLVERIVSPAPAEEIAVAPTSHTVRVGDRAEHRRFKLVGQVIAIEGQRVHLASGGKKIEVSLDDLRPVKDGKKPVDSRQPASRTNVDAEEPEVSAELNLIGKRVDDAIEESDKFLDRALLAGRGAVRLIHGHGSGALRKALREYLKKHVAVKSFRPGNEREGGDGATIAILDV